MDFLKKKKYIKKTNKPMLLVNSIAPKEFKMRIKRVVVLNNYDLNGGNYFKM